MGSSKITNTYKKEIKQCIKKRPFFFFHLFFFLKPQESFSEFSDQFVDVDDDIVNARSHRSLWLQHPSHELVKSFRVRSLWSSVWPFDLSVHDCELKTSTGFSKRIFEWRHSVPATRRKKAQNEYPQKVNEYCRIS